jgi:serine/threonine protein kinase
LITARAENQVLAFTYFSCPGTHLKASTGKAFGMFSGSCAMRTGNPYIGRYFGNYQVIAEIDCGSFGCVYQAQHTFLPRVAAIKLLHVARLRSQEAHNAFLQEAQLLERLKHPNILQIYEFGLDDGLPYLVIEYASRGSLRDLLNSRTSQLLPLRDVISIIAQVGQALYYAHQQGVIHHDLKPENILFNEQNDALLADFGIAIVRTTTLEQVADMNGTPAYMAPEQFRGKASRRSDQYSLACIMYELVTGRRPFTAPDAISMGLKHMQESPIPPTWLNPNLPPQMERVILKALEKRLYWLLGTSVYKIDSLIVLHWHGCLPFRLQSSKNWEKLSLHHHEKASRLREKPAQLFGWIWHVRNTPCSVPTYH